MAAVTVPAGGSLLGKVTRALQARAKLRTGKPSTLAAAAVRAREHVTTFAALAAFDLGAFQLDIPHCGSAPGWLAVAVSLLLAHFAVEG